MKTVWKYEIPVLGITELKLPEGTVFLPHLEMDPGGSQSEYDHTVWVWAEVPKRHRSDPERTRYLRLHGTDHQIPTSSTYIGTVRDGEFVWHLYEVIPS